MATPRALIVTEQGINCEDETKKAIELAGGVADIVHLEELIRKNNSLDNYQMLIIPGGFSYGDHTGSGKAFANRIKNNYWEETLRFIEDDTLTLGICNGFQVLVNTGILPALNNYTNQQVGLTHNEDPRYICRWVDLKFEGGGPWTQGLSKLSMPIAHGEGRFVAEQKTLSRLNEKGMVGARYVGGVMCAYQSLESNPNGSVENIAAITNESKRVLGMMPHPERALFFTQRPDWQLRKEQQKRGVIKEISEYGDGLKLFENAVRYFE